jgi:GntR family transcriptional regulator
MALNPADPRPLYQQLAALLREQIDNGTLQPGTQLPTEGDLADKHDTSRNTVRLALNLLRTEGLVESRRGLGSYVRSAPPARYYASLVGSRRNRLTADRRRDTFAQQVESHGKTPRQSMSVEVIPASIEIAARLHLEPDQDVCVRRRVMYADDQPIQLGDSFYPLELVKSSKIMDPADIVEGSDQVLEDLGHTPTRYEDEITWRMPSADEATKLHIPPATPIGRVLRVTFDQDDKPIEAYQVILPGDRHILFYEVSAE